VAKPSLLDNKVLVEIHAASVSAYDWHFLTADVFLIRLMSGGLLKPKKTTLGADVAGRVIAVGKEIKKFQVGDDVFGTAEALRYLGEGHAKGKIIVTVEHGTKT
jgi:NADPH:quinone reductase-like Zn-dependent oxidoreductase